MTLFISYQPADRLYVERLHRYLTERGVPSWFDVGGQPDGFVDRAALDRIEQARAVVAVGETGGQPRGAAELAHARRLDKPVHEIPADTVAGGWLPGDDFIAAVGGAVAAGAMPSGVMYADAADLVLDHAGDRWLKVIQSVVLLTGAELRNVRTLVVDAPSIVLGAVRKHLAEAVAELLAAEGATVRVVPAGAAPEVAVTPETIDSDALAAALRRRYTLSLESHGPNKLKVVAVVKRMADLGLKEAKDLVEGAPRVIASGWAWPEAVEAAVELTKTGATATLHQT
jgi:large subunit ribosomal protein L7/L12